MLHNPASGKCLVATGAEPGSMLQTAVCDRQKLQHFDLVSVWTYTLNKDTDNEASLGLKLWSSFCLNSCIKPEYSKGNLT